MQPLFTSEHAYSTLNSNVAPRLSLLRSSPEQNRPQLCDVLRPVEIYREFITAAARWMMAAKL